LRPKPLLIFILIVVCIAGDLHAQLCQGSLGDPVVNITFGSGTSSQRPFALTNYSFVSNDCPNDGSYTLINRTSGCFGNTWHSVENHTPNDANGLMMLINASVDTGDFYIDTIKNLCPNTTYEFAAWIVNILRPSACGGSGISPKITFAIETTTGTPIKNYKSGNIPSTSSPEWKQYGFFFTTAPGMASVVIRLTNGAPGGCGNDLALDDITFRPCGPSVDATINGFSALDTINVCEDSTGSPYTINGLVSSGYENPSLQWQLSTDGGANFSDISNANNATYLSKVTAVGSYLYRLAVAEGNNISSTACRINSNIIRLNINPLPVIQARSNSPVCGNEDLMLSAGGGSVYHWSGPAGFASADSSAIIPHPTQNYAGLYKVNVTTASGCDNTDSVTVGIFPAAVAEAGSDVTICEGSAARLQGSGGVSYEWRPLRNLSSPASQSTSASPIDTTLYYVTVTDEHGCKATDSVSVNVLHKPVANAGPDKVILGGQSTQLQGSVAGDSIRFVWSPSSGINNTNTLQPTVNPEHDITYTLFAISKAGCGTASDNVFVRVFEKVNVPNAFSPNGDGINDTWRMDAIETYPECIVEVFNRYGQPVYKSKGYSRNWDGTYNGKPLPVATYYYVIELDKALPKLSGWVALLR